MNILIIGSGIAGLSAAEEIRKKDKEVNIEIITKENCYTYYRTRLSHFLPKDFNIEEIYVKPENWYKENNIKVHLNSKVESIDTVGKTIKLLNNRELAYDKLLFANGAFGFIPPIEGKEKEGVFALRGIDDLKAIQDYAKKTKKGIVIGGGLLGLEVASSLNKLGIETTVIEFFDRLLPRQLDSEGSEILKNIVEQEGVKLLLGAQVESIRGEDKVEGCKIKDGAELEASLVLFSAGVRSNIGLAKEIGLEINRAIVVDKYMNTSEKDIYAAGDVCEYNEKSFAIWPIAMEQGKIAGINILGGSEEYKEIVPSNMLNIMGSKIYSIGDIGTKEEEYQILKVKDENKNILKKLFFLNGKLVGGILINDIAISTKLKNLISSEKDYSEILSKDISDEEKINFL